MHNIDYNKLKFLESSSNIKLLVKEVVGREPSSKLASEISVCLQQGRMFFETATDSPTEIKPLQIFYGMIGFAKALTLARTLKNIETLTQSHGLKDITSPNSFLEDIQLKIQSKGTFQDFNNVISQFDRVHYFDKYSMPKWHFIPTSKSNNLCDKTITLKEIMARLLALNDLYKDTFQESPKNVMVDIQHWEEDNGYTELRIDDPEIFSDRHTMIEIVNKWREKFPFINNWCFCQATKAWGNSILIFCNIDKSTINEFDEANLAEEDGCFSVNRNFRRDNSLTRIDFRTILPPLFGGLRGGSGSVAEPYDGEYISEYSLYYLGMFLLSSLVRYRPQVWAHSLSRSVTTEKCADDRALAIIEEFMNSAIVEYPNMVYRVLKTKIEQ